MNIKSLAEKDLQTTLEGEFGIPIVLTAPDGSVISKTVDGRPLLCKAAWAQPTINADGQEVVVPNPVVWLRRASLARTPKSGEKWFVRIPVSPAEGAEMGNFLIDENYAVSGGRGLGRVRLPLVLAENAV
jgi:hypothetical protein